MKLLIYYTNIFIFLTNFLLFTAVTPHSEQSIEARHRHIMEGLRNKYRNKFASLTNLKVRTFHDILKFSSRWRDKFTPEET